MVAPIRRPVNEPGPDINVISVRSWKDWWLSASLSWMNLRSFSAKSLAKVYLYSTSSSLRIVSGVEVSRYIFILLYYIISRIGINLVGRNSDFAGVVIGVVDSDGDAIVWQEVRDGFAPFDDDYVRGVLEIFC